MADPHVAEGHRFCPNPGCGAPVGRRRDAIPGRTEGFCAQCRQPFSFTPRLRAGSIVGGQYEIVGCLAHGGLGWIYLARDRNVENVWRVLKGLLQRGDEDAIANALDERRFLASVDHPNIVKIINFVEHGGDGYIVMEYVDGVSVRDVLRERRAMNGGRSSPLPVTHAIAYVLDVLPALDYLHQRGLLYCDFKPDNIMLTATTVKLIDLGGVYRIDDRSSPVYGTVGFQAPEIAETGPTISSDLYALARTLVVLCNEVRGFQTTYRYALPPPDEVPQLAAHDALYQLVRRATATDPSVRFASAGEMASQLTGVLREIVARETGRPAPGVSANFTGPSFTGGAVDDRLDEPDWRCLPVPLVDADDPAAGYLATIAANDPDAFVNALQRAPQRTIEVELQLVRALLDADRVAEATTALDALGHASDDWRCAWYRGVRALAIDDALGASRAFTVVYHHLPGELAPKLGLALAFERGRNPLGASPWYDTVSRTDQSFTAASFGLARCRLMSGDRAGTIEAYGRVPASSSRHVPAQAALVRVLLSENAGMRPVVDAARIVEQLPLVPARRAELEAEVLETALTFVAGGRDTGWTGTTLFGHECSEPGVRRALDRTYRVMARYAVDAEQRIALIERANQVRPRTLW
jgi:serine/threonine-protein kinase PknG